MTLLLPGGRQMPSRLTSKLIVGGILALLALIVFFMLGFVWLGLTMRAMNKAKRLSA